MTRLANPAAVARFADDNVAHFPDGESGDGGVCLANVKFVNDTPGELDLYDIAFPVNFFNADNHTVDMDFAADNKLAGEGELEAVVAAMILKSNLQFFSYSTLTVTIEDLVNAEVETVDEETGRVKPINTSEPSSFTVIYVGSAT